MVPAETALKGLRGLILLGIVFVAMIGLLTVQQREQERQAAQPTPFPTPHLFRVFPDLEVLQIQAVQLAAPGFGRTFTMSRAEDGTWQGVGMDGTLDTQMATAIARTLALLPYRQRFDIDDNTDLRQFGFRPTGDLLIQFITVFGDEHVVAIGEPSFEGPTFYALVDDRPQVYLLDRAPIDFLVDLYLEPPLLPPEPDQ